MLIVIMLSVLAPAQGFESTTGNWHKKEKKVNELKQLLTTFFFTAETFFARKERKRKKLFRVVDKKAKR